MIEQISKFVDVLNAAASGTPHRVKFSLLKFPSATEYILTGDKLLYNKNIKLFHKILRDMLYGNLDVSSSPIDHLPAEPILFFDIHQFVWETINRISDEDITSICKNIETIRVSKTKHPVKDFSLFSHDSIDSIVVFYFQVIPKPALLFLQDFETTVPVHYYRSLLRMALLDYIKLDSLEAPLIEKKQIPAEEPAQIISPSVIKEVEPVPPVKPLVEEATAPPPVPELDELKFKEDIERQIDQILQEKKNEPAVPVPVEQKKEGNNSTVSKTRIENLKKILRNIKQL